MLKPLFSLLLCVPVSSAPVEHVSCQTEPSKDVKQSIGKPYVPEITYFVTWS